MIFFGKQRDGYYQLLRHIFPLLYLQRRLRPFLILISPLYEKHDLCGYVTKRKFGSWFVTGIITVHSAYMHKESNRSNADAIFMVGRLVYFWPVQF
jgi:hypothetical protein